MTDVAVPFPTARLPAVKAIASAPESWFTRPELDRLFRLYGRMVAAGEWRDYGLSDLSDRTIFSVFRRACETALYRVEKIPRQAKRQGAFQIVSATGVILKRGHSLEQVLDVLERKLFKITD